MKRRRHSDLYVGLSNKKGNMILLVHRVLDPPLPASSKFRTIPTSYRLYRVTYESLKVFKSEDER